MDDLFRWLEQLPVTQGDQEHFEMLEWEREFLTNALAPYIRIAALTMARGGGKSTFLGALAAAAFDGPLSQRRADVVIVSGVLAQARIVFQHAKAFLRLEERSKYFKISDNSMIADVTNLKTGARLRAIASNPDYAHGLAPLFVIADEPAKWQAGTSAKMWSALTTSLGKISGSKIFAIGTLPESKLHWFTRLFDDGPAADKFCMKYYEPDRKSDLLDPASWLLANPSLPHFPALRKAYQQEAEEAMIDEQAEARFRALRLNQGTPEVDDRDLLVPVERWMECQQPEVERHGPYVLGLDLGGSEALSAAAAYWPHTGQLCTMAACGDVPDPETRERKDGVPGVYRHAIQARQLLLTNGRVADVAVLLEACRLAWGEPMAIVADAYRQAELLDILEKRGLFYDVVFRSPGAKHATEDIKLFRNEAIAGRLRVEKSQLLDHHIGRAAVMSDSSGHTRLAKKAEGGRSSRSRDDLAAAAVLAVSHGTRIGADVESGAFCGVV